MSELEPPPFDLPPQTRPTAPSMAEPRAQSGAASLGQLASSDESYSLAHPGLDGSPDIEAVRRAPAILTLSAEDRIAPPQQSGGGGRGLVLSVIAIATLLAGAGASYYVLLDTGPSQGAGPSTATPADPVAVAAVRPPLEVTGTRVPPVEPTPAAAPPLETGALTRPADMPSAVESPPATPVDAQPVASETAPTESTAAASPLPPSEPAAAVAAPPAPPVVVAGPSGPPPQAPTSSPAAGALKIINAVPPATPPSPPVLATVPSPEAPVTPSSAPATAKRATAPAPRAAPPVKASQPKPPASPPQKVARADVASGAAVGRPLPPVSGLPPATARAGPPAGRQAVRTPPSGLASERLAPPSRTASASSRDPLLMRAAAAGLHPRIPRDLLERLSPADLRNAGIAVQTAVAEAPDGEVYVYPRERRADLANYQVRMLRAVHPECRRYVVTVTKDGLSTTAPPMENCEVLPSRGSQLPPPDGPPPLRY